ncbi:hypothetical protein ABIB40_000200 [Pedobacter sp. UYP30]|uniref:hypothetical protein n=1 Tax=Pedobacter sp. UYP30 TaxID=1756400 RepID=UPI003399307B
MKFKNNALFLILPAVLTLACQNNEKVEKPQKNDNSRDSGKVSIIGSYQNILKKDTFQLVIKPWR